MRKLALDACLCSGVILDWVPKGSPGKVGGRVRLITCGTARTLLLWARL